MSYCGSCGEPYLSETGHKCPPPPELSDARPGEKKHLLSGYVDAQGWPQPGKPPPTAEKCTCGHDRKDHFEETSVCLKACDCILFRKGEEDG